MSTRATVSEATPSQHPIASNEPGRLRRFLLAILLLELAGIGAELLLSGHYEDPWQWAPLALILGCVLILAWFAASPSRTPLHALQALMGLFILSGLLGLVLHFRAKMEFQLEVNPSLRGAALFREAVKSQSPPTLAPAIMIQMGLLGLAYAYRHPASKEIDQQESR